MSEARMIKRYTNRKLYDTKESRYVTLSQIATLVRAGEDIQVIDNATKDNLTSLTLAQIIYEQEKRSSEVLPLSSLRELVRRGEARLADLKEGPVGRLLVRNEGEHDSEVLDEAVEEGDDQTKKGLIQTSQKTLEEWQKRVDDRLKALVDTLAPFRQLQEEMGRVTTRLEELESRLLKRRGGSPESTPASKDGTP